MSTIFHFLIGEYGVLIYRDELNKRLMMKVWIQKNELLVLTRRFQLNCPSFKIRSTMTSLLPRRIMTSSWHGKSYFLMYTHHGTTPRQNGYRPVVNAACGECRPAIGWSSSISGRPCWLLVCWLMASIRGIRTTGNQVRPYSNIDFWWAFAWDDADWMSDGHTAIVWISQP